MRGASAFAVPVSAGPRVAIASFGSGEWHLVLELLLAHALRLRGASPSLLVCDLPDLPMCDERTAFSRHLDRCDGCIRAKRGLLEAARLPWRGVGAFVDASAISRAVARVNGIADQALTDHRERGLPIGQWLHVSGCHFLRGDERGADPYKIAARRRLLASAIVVLEAVEKWLDESRPDVVIAESGAHLHWRIAFEAARARGINVVCREMGKGGWDRHIYALNRDAMAPDLDEAWAAASADPLTDDEEGDVEALVDRLPADTYRPVPAPAAARLEIPRSAARIAVAFTNVTWDLATAGRDVAFSGVGDWLRATIAAVARHAHVHLIVRAHPAEAGFLTGERILDHVRREWPAGVPNVTLIEPEAPISARELCAAADLVLGYNSTAALEAAARGHTVVVCGRPHFRGRGFTIDVESRDEYRSLLEAWAEGRGVARPPASATLARRYFHLFFARYHVAMGWTTSPLEPPFRLLVRSIDELAPGRNPALDAVCEGILEGRPILLPRQRREVPCVQ